MSNPTTHPQKSIPRLRAITGRIRIGFGDDLTADLLEEDIDVVDHVVGRVAAAADAIKEGVGQFARHLQEFTADGHLDPRERRILAQDQAHLTAQAHHQTTEISVIR